MTTARAVLLIGVVALAGAAAVAVSSRTPGSVRTVDPPPELNDPSLGATFTKAQIERHAADRRPTYVAFIAGIAIELTLLLTLAR